MFDINDAIAKGEELNINDVLANAPIFKMEPSLVTKAVHYKIYFIQAGTMPAAKIKIGYSGDVRKRVRGIQLNSPDPRIILLATIEAGTTKKEADKKEKELHSLFEADRSHGEWFNPSKNLIDYISKINSNIFEIYHE